MTGRPRWVVGASSVSALAAAFIFGPGCSASADDDIRDACVGAACRDARDDGDGLAGDADGAGDLGGDGHETSGDGSLDGDGVCGDIEVNVTPRVPTVVIVIDQSGSMNEDFGSSSRWRSLRESLLASPDGLIDELDEIVHFGVALYTSRGGAPPCPLLTVVDPAPRNFTAIQAVYGPAEPIGDTPTGESIVAVTDRMVSVGWEDEAALILATDGEPDTCAEPSPSTDAEREAARRVSTDAVTRAFGSGIRTYVISVGEGAVSAAHLQDLANAGLGLAPTDPDAPYWVAGDDASLRDALRTIVGTALSCVFELNGRLILEAACSGTVVLNGRELACDDPDGWHAVDETHIELTGTACEEVTSGDTVDLRASFPCDAVILM